MERSLSPIVARSRGGERGFTLVELLVVMMILGILMGILVAVVPEVIGTGKDFTCQQNLRHINEMRILYVRKFGGSNMVEPTEKGEAYLRKLMTKVGQPTGGDPDLNIYSCPYAGRNPKENPEDKNAIDYRGPADNINPNSNYSSTDPIVGDRILPNGNTQHGSSENEGANVLTKGGGVYKVTSDDAERWQLYQSKTIE